LIFSPDWSSHLHDINDVFNRLIEAHLVISPTSCFFGFPELKFAGQIISSQGLKPDPDLPPAFIPNTPTDSPIPNPTLMAESSIPSTAKKKKRHKDPAAQRPSLKRTRSFADLPAAFLPSSKKTTIPTLNSTNLSRPTVPPRKIAPILDTPKPSPRFIYFDPIKTPSAPNNDVPTVSPSRIPVPIRPAHLRPRDVLQTPLRFR
jgi:hypothetical protein